MKYVFKILALVFALLFIWAAYVQQNDPDALLWYAIYGVAALTSILFALGRLNFMTSAVLCVVYLVGTFLLWPDKFEGFTIGEGDIVNIERGREACGLLIVSVVLLIFALRIRFEKSLKV